MELGETFSNVWCFTQQIGCAKGHAVQMLHKSHGTRKKLEIPKPQKCIDRPWLTAAESLYSFIYGYVLWLYVVGL